MARLLLFLAIFLLSSSTAFWLPAGGVAGWRSSPPAMMGRSRAPKQFKSKSKPAHDEQKENAAGTAASPSLSPSLSQPAVESPFSAVEVEAVTYPPFLDEEINPGAVEGTDLRILEYPHPRLRAPNTEVVEFDDSLRSLTREMFAIMYASRGVGLAAPQLGINKRLMVFNPEGKKEKWMSEVVLCNPRIVEWGPGRDVEEEGCLSFPGFTADVERAVWIKVEFQNGRGKKMAKKYAGWEARIFQHEYDHLDGILYVDRLTEAERARIQPELDRLVEAHGPGGAL